MREMVLRGPSQYDCLLIYENLAIDFLGAAKDRWGELHVDYPEPNIWNEHPFYILDVPWSNARQRTAATAFLKFLMSEPIQKRAARTWLPARQSRGFRAISGEPTPASCESRCADRFAPHVRAAQG